MSGLDVVCFCLVDLTYLPRHRVLDMSVDL